MPDPGAYLQGGGGWTPDGKIAAISQSTGPGAVFAWNSRNGRLVRRFRFPPNGVLGLAISPDGSRLAAAGGGTTGRLWNFDSGRMLATLSGHQDVIFGIHFSPDGARQLFAEPRAIVQQIGQAELGRDVDEL